MAKTNKKRLKRKLLDKYRLVVLNESTFEERFSLKLNRLNVFVLIVGSSVLLIGLTFLVIVSTPLKEYIPGYASTSLRRQATEMTYKTDSLTIAINNTNRYVESLRKVLLGQISYQEIASDTSIQLERLDIDAINLEPIAQDYRLREEVALEEKYNLFANEKSTVIEKFFNPIKGMISQKFDPTNEHFGIDVISTQGSPVLAIKSGVVVFAEWSVDTGHVIIIKHADNQISIYKHNQSLTKTQGQQIKGGEVIAFVGNSGKMTTGAHLHFELWVEGKPVNPENYFDF